MRGKEVRRFLGTQVTTFRVAEYEPHRRFSLQDDPGVWALERTYEIEPRHDGALVTFVFDMLPRARWFRLLHPLVRGVIQRQVRANMNRLQALLSQTPKT